MVPVMVIGCPYGDGLALNVTWPILGAVPSAGLTVRAKAWLALPTVLLAVSEIVYTPETLGSGVPARVAVPFPKSVRLTPVGSDEAVIVGSGEPYRVVIGKEKGKPALTE